MKELLESIVKTTNSRAIGRVISSKANRELNEWVSKQTAHLPSDSTLIERIQCILNPNLIPYCEYGNKRRFVSNPPEYRFCGTVAQCRCYQKNYAQIHPALDQQTLKHIINKRKETWLEKYGVDNPSKNSAISSKRKSTMKNRSYRKMYENLQKNKQINGYHAVVDRVKNYVKPLFTADEYSGCFRKNSYRWMCNTCNSVVVDHVDYGRIPRCLKCHPNGESKVEKFIGDYVKSLGFDIKLNSKEVLKNLEYDIWIPEKRIAIEYNGIYWHSIGRKNPSYHVNKFIKSRDAGVKLIQIFEDEWINHSDIIKRRLNNILGVDQKIYARKCKVTQISGNEYQQFVKMYHLQGYAAAAYKYGLWYNNELVAVMSFSKSRYTKEGYEMIRYCSKDTVIGGAGKLFKRFINDVCPTKVISYANRCWSDGNLYLSLGFVNTTKDDFNTGYWYIKNNQRFHRSTFTKSKLLKLGYDPSLTESEIMNQAGYLRIYDCGNYRFEWCRKTVNNVPFCTN